MLKSTTIHSQKCVAPTHRTTKLNKLKKLLLPPPELKKRSRYFEILGNPNRLQIAHLLQKEKRLCVCDLVEVIGLSPSALSQHLRKMRDCGLVDFEREGQTIFYFLMDNKLCKFLI